MRLSKIETTSVAHHMIHTSMELTTFQLPVLNYY